MTLLSLVRQAREMWQVPRDLVLRRYPEFVRGGALPRGQVPVFVFHSLEHETFSRKLEYLSSNGYVSLDATEYFQFLMGTRPPPERAVLLTFDDGRGSLWSIGLPLMRRYGMRGIVFLVPGRTTSRPGPLPPTWDDVHARRERPSEITDREQSDGAFLSWEEIEAMSRSGHFEFESHTLNHARIHVQPRVVDFVTPWSRLGCPAMDVPIMAVSGTDRLAGDLPLGTPILASRPRTSEGDRFYESEEIRAVCAGLVAREGGAAFFERKDWPRILRRLMAGREIPGRRETAAEKEAAIRRELAEARTLIEARTGRGVTHLCYPWHAAGPTAHRLAREVGYRTAFAGKVPGVPITLAGGDPHAIARIGEDYVELLPGRERSDLAEILRRKWRRRRGKGAV